MIGAPVRGGVPLCNVVGKPRHSDQDQRIDQLLDGGIYLGGGGIVAHKLVCHEYAQDGDICQEVDLDGEVV